jgi:GNAT superfamily N-acetyltransferase
MCPDILVLDADGRFEEDFAPMTWLRQMVFLEFACTMGGASEKESTGMDNECTIVNMEKSTESAWRIIGRGIKAYNDEQAGDYGRQILCYAVQDAEGEIRGGVVAAVRWDWLYVDLMWLEEDLRGRGYGSRLLALVEGAGRKRGARHAHLDTFTFQAPGFYEKHGYRVFGELPDFPAGHRRLYMTKDF